MRTKVLLLTDTLIVLLLASSCNKPVDNIIPSSTAGVYITNEGNYGSGNGEVSFHDPASMQVTNNLFYGVNNFHPGDVVESIYIKDSLGFIVVNNSQRVLEVKIPSFKYVRTDTLLNSSPRYFLPINDSIAYVTELYKSEIHVINYRTGARISEITGLNEWTEHMILVGNSVIVEEKNSASAPATNDTLAVINTTTNTFQQYSFPGGGAMGIALDNIGHIWMASDQNANNGTPAAIYCLNSDMSVNKKLVFPMGHHPSNLCIDGAGEKLYFFDSDLFTISINDVAVPTNTFVNRGGHNFYGLALNPNNGDVYVSDAKNYVQNSIIYQYDRNGNSINSFATGIISGNFTFN